MPPELFRPVLLSQVPAAGRDLEVRATPDECLALAGRLGIETLRDLTAALRLKPEQDGPVLVTGRLQARLAQLCVVSLEPVAQRVETTIAWRLLPPGRAASDTPDDSVDEIETTNGPVDLGELLAEELALALDPYPRHPNAALPPEASDANANPFARLAALKPPRPPN